MSSDEESYWRRYDYEFGRGHRVEAEAASVPRGLAEEMRLFSFFYVAIHEGLTQT